MKKYNRDLISKYINGEEIIDYNIEELEDDKDFMMQVISISNDYNFYNLCSEKVKLDYDFIKYLILKFKNNINFICDVANEYIEKTEDDFARTELALIMRDLTKNNEETPPCVSLFITCDSPNTSSKAWVTFFVFMVCPFRSVLPNPKWQPSCL